jgi:UDP-3-O-[3-hydroxymyristoyl] N-acetylglucosamine deacetylase
MLGEFGPSFQHTLKSAIGCRGVALHSGQKVSMNLIPAPPETGIIFRRTDVGAEIRASWDNVIESARCTSLSDGARGLVATVEHLMAALSGTAIDNLIVELDGPEVPIMDGSAAPFVFLIECAGVVRQNAPRRPIKILKPVSVVDDGAMAALYPDFGFSMSFEIDYDNPLVRRQQMTLALDTVSFKSELSPARTFGFRKDVDRLRAAGLARGGSLDNVIVVDGRQVLNRGGLRYENEFVRHKLLDALGDLYLAGAPIIGRFRGVRSGHSHNHRLLKALFADEEARSYAATDPASRAFHAVAAGEELRLTA